MIRTLSFMPVLLLFVNPAASIAAPADTQAANGLPFCAVERMHDGLFL